MNYFIIQESDGLVVNCVVWDGISPWEPPEGHLAIQSDIGGIGWTWNGTEFVPPEPPPEEPLPEEPPV